MNIQIQKAEEVLGGVMLSDAALTMNGKNAHFYMDLSGKKLGIPNSGLLGYLRHVNEDCLDVLGIEACIGYPKVFTGLRKSGKPYEFCILQTNNSALLTSEYLRWYRKNPSGKMGKQVPEDLVLTPVSLAHWFMGDGSSNRDNRSVFHTQTINTYFATGSFNEHGVQLLESQLRYRFGLDTGRGQVRAGEGAGIIITVLQSSVNIFMELIDPHVEEPYRYKVKYKR